MLGVYHCGSDGGSPIRPISEHGVEFDRRDNGIQIKKIQRILDKLTVFKTESCDLESQGVN